MKTKRILKITTFALIIALASLSFYLFADNSKLLFADVDASEKPLRLHVLANSDSTFDQQLKLEVRDYIIEIIEPKMANIEDKDTAIVMMESLIPQLTIAANAFLADKTNYQAELSLQKADFPEIDYNGLVFAAGEYDSLRVILGQGEGKNWWCVLFPPMCFVDLAAEFPSKEVMAVWADYEDSESSNGIQIKWKLQELFSRDR